MERFIENLMYRSRWLLAPIYLGLSLALIALGVKFFQEVWHLLWHILSLAEADLVLVILTLVDLAMVGGLLVMVMMSGYENFVSALDVAARYGFSHYDSLIIAAALESGCSTLYSEDLRHGQVIDQHLTIINPFKPGR